MRLLHVGVPDDRREDVFTTLDGMDLDYVVTRGERTFEDGSVVEIPVPTDAVGPVLDALHDAGIEEGTYTVIASAESADTPHMETLQDRYADDYDPLSRTEMRSKARDLSRDPRSFYALMVLSALIATAGLLADSPAVVVGSMVIAPIVGPALTASVGAVTGDRRMMLDSIRLQTVGLGVGIVTALLLGVGLRAGSFAPATLDLAAIELISVRLAPTALALVIGVASGAAAALGLTTKGPLSLIGVMIAAALIPTAAATGIAIAWGDPLVALGTLALLSATVIAINLAAFTTLRSLGYRPHRGPGRLRGFDSTGEAVTVLLVSLVLVALVAATGVATANQVAFDRGATQEVETVLDDPEYADLTTVAVRSEYSDLSPFTRPETVTVVVSQVGDADHPELAETMAHRIGERTDREVTVRVRFIEYDQQPPEEQSR